MNLRNEIISETTNPEIKFHTGLLTLLKEFTYSLTEIPLRTEKMKIQIIIYLAFPFLLVSCTYLEIFHRYLTVLE